MSAQFLLVAFIAATLGYAFLNGVHDSGRLVAGAIFSRSSPRSALALASLAEFLGPFLFGAAVATFIGKNLAQVSAIATEFKVLFALFSAPLLSMAGYFKLSRSLTQDASPRIPPARSSRQLSKSV